MAEEFMNLPSTPDTIKSNEDTLMRNSGGNSNSGGKRIPHYLRPPAGSCHDKCKYGTDHSFEKSKRTPVRKRITTPPPAPGSQNSVEIFTLEDGNRMMYVKNSSSPTATGESSMRTKREVSAPSNKLEASLKPVASNTKESTLSAKVSISKPKATAANGMSSPGSSAPSSSRRNNNASNATEACLLERCASSLTPKSVTAKPSTRASGGSSSGRGSDIKIHEMPKISKGAVKKAPASPMPTVSKLTSLSAEKTASPKSVPHLTHQNRTRTVKPNQPNYKTVLEKTLYVIQMERDNKTLLPAETLTPAGVNTLVSAENRGPDENQTCLSVQTESVDVDKTLESAENGSGAVRSTSSSPLVSPKGSPGVLVPQPLSSQEDDNLDESEYTDSETDESVSEDDETLIMDQSDQKDTPEAEEYKTGHRKARHVLSHDKDGNPVKLSFRRGKVVDITSDNNGPRRLRFRRGRVLGDHQNVKDETRSRRFKKREQVDGDGTNPVSEKVKLRHQDVQDKKDAQGLFNNVIEKTASKLAQTRSSKVKALVGAFETVISLQDSKPT